MIWGKESQLPPWRRVRIAGGPAFTAVTYQALASIPYLVLRSGCLLFPMGCLRDLDAALQSVGESFIGRVETQGLPVEGGIILPGASPTPSSCVISTTQALAAFLMALGIQVYATQVPGSPAVRYLIRANDVPPPTAELCQEQGREAPSFRAALLAAVDQIFVPLDVLATGCETRTASVLPQTGRPVLQTAPR